MPPEAMELGKFVAPQLYVSNATVERLGELLQARPQGMLQLMDELAALFMNMSRYSGGQDDEFWLESWNGDPHAVERMGRMLSVDHLLIGVVGGMQPDKLVASFEGDHDGKYAKYFQNDGGSWPRLYTENPKVRGIVTISLPAYDEKTGLVVLYKGTHIHGLQGSGEAILYRYERGELKKLKSVTLWIA